MSNYVYTEQGRMNDDQEDLRTAADYLDMMSFTIKSRKAEGGFTRDSVLYLIKRWFQAAEKLRGTWYRKHYYPSFVREAAPVPPGKKASDFLLQRVQRLSAIPPTAAVGARIPYFVEAEAAIFSFVAEYRNRLKAQNSAEYAQFVGEILSMGRRTYL
jgi:hypothetical protein